MKRILYLLAILSIISCGESNSQIVVNLAAPKFQQLIKKQPGIIIDVRTSQEFHSGHLKEASNVDFYSESFLDKLKILRKDVPIFLYCRSGGRSSLAASMMVDLGFDKVYNLIGGIGSWNSKNYLTIKSKKVISKVHATFSIEEIDNFLESHETVLLDFSTEWCVPCKKMKPIITQIKEENLNYGVLFIDADANNELVKKYQIRGVPVFIVFKDSQEVFRHIGVISKTELLKQLN